MRRRYVISSVVLGAAVAAAGVISACSSSSNNTGPSDAGPDVAVVDHDGGPGVAPIDGLSSDYVAKFWADEAIFDTDIAPADGLGPLYTKTSCVECHSAGARGPGEATKMAIVYASDGLTPLADQSLLAFGATEHPLIVNQIPGVHTPILPPFEGTTDGGADAGAVTVRVTQRLGPPIFGRGYMEAVLDSEIERMETAQAGRSDGIKGRANRLTFVSQPNPDPTFDNHQTGDTVIGRFGLKGRIATLDEFSADALQGDIGATSPMRPNEFANPDNVTDDLKPGVDLTADEMNARRMYVRLLAIPPRDQNPFITQGKAWFESCTCNVCHAESLHTRSDYPIPQLANIDAPIYTDMLLHDMGDGLSDSVEGGNEGQATGRDWRTLPLIGLRFSTSYLHDGRAATIADAILAHDSNGSEATASVQCYQKLVPNLQQQVQTFVGSL